MQKTTHIAITTKLLTDVVSISELTERCSQAVNNYLQGTAYDEQFCLKLLCNAALQNDEPAWQALESCFHQVMWRWLDCHPVRKEMKFVRGDEEVVAQALMEFRRSVVDQRKEFPTLAAALCYLLLCLNSVILDMVRTSHRLLKIRWLEQPVVDDAACTQETLQQLLPNVREQRLAYLLFHCGLAPAEIVCLCPQEFSDLQEISHLRYRIMQRLVSNIDRF